MMREYRSKALFLFLPLILLCSGCGETKLRLRVDRSIISAGGCDRAIITATVEVDDEPKASKEVEFETTLGSFSAIQEETTATVTTNSKGEAVVELYGTSAVGQATVTAYYSDDNGDVSKSVGVMFGVPSGQFAPVSDRMSLDCDARNIGALRSQNRELRVTCHFMAQTASGCRVPLGAYVPGDTMFLISEVGSLEVVEDYWSEETELIYRTAGGSSKPVDVEPISGEPSRLGPLGETFNPRDGVATLLVVVQGREGFTDTNGNGMYDSNEAFDDLAEPFLDVDDDGVFTMGTDTYFADSNGDSQYTEANGTYDSTTFIGVAFKMVLSGDLEEHDTAAKMEMTGSENIPNGGSFTISVHLLDKHLNPIAGFTDADDTIYFNVNGYVSVIPSSYYSYLQNRSAILWGPDLTYQEYDPQMAVYTVTLTDSDSSWEYDPPRDWTMSVEVEATAGADNDDYWVDSDQYNFTQVLHGTSR